MLRIIVRRRDVAAAVNVDGPVDVTYRTFDVDLPEIERCLTDNGGYADAAYVTTEVIGVEVLKAREGKC